MSLTWTRTADGLRAEAATMIYLVRRDNGFWLLDEYRADRSIAGLTLMGERVRSTDFETQREAKAVAAHLDDNASATLADAISFVLLGR